jgi:hypothetical protein
MKLDIEKKIRMNVSLDANSRALLKKLAKENNTTMSKIIDIAIHKLSKQNDTL